MTEAEQLRSGSWFAGTDEVAMLHRVALGDSSVRDGKPVIGIADTTSALNPCQAGFDAIIPVLEREIEAAGGVPARFPVMSLGEDLMKPSAMLYRNLAAMELEENARAYPLDAVIYLVNCDKTVPAAMMAAASADLPGMLLLGGSRAAPPFRGKPVGSGTDLWRALHQRASGELDDAGWQELETTLACAGAGSCNTMGTATTMALMAEVLGLALPGAAGVVAGDPALVELARSTARLTVERARTRSPLPAQVMTPEAFTNAYRVLAAIGGSTNAVIHLAAVARRLGLAMPLRTVDEWWADVPLLVDVEPCGSALAHDFAAAGGLGTLVQAMAQAGLIDASQRAGDGGTLAELAERSPVPTDDGVIRLATAPVAPAPTMAAVFGNLAPDGAVIKVASASDELLQHTGRAVVFDSYHDMRARLDDPAGDIQADDVIVVRGCGPVGVPGMPEWGMAPIPAPLAQRGVADMVRVSDGRMSGTSFGTVVLHCAPESAIGGPLALVRDGDPIALHVAARRIDLLVEPAELAAREAAWVPPRVAHDRGWPKVYRDHVTQAPEGCDLDFMTPAPGSRGPWIEPVVGRS